MANKEGYWIGPDGRVYEVIEHFTAVQEKPLLFGFRKAEVAGWTRADREPVLLRAFRRGWIRVRGHGNYTTFDVDTLNEDAIFRIKDFLEKTNAWDNEAVKVVEHRYGRQYDSKVEAFRNDEMLSVARNPRRRRARR